MKVTKVENKGITLIALVITIIVLLILAGVSIATLTGENGILTKTRTSKENAEMGEEIEFIKVAYNGAKIGKLGKEIIAGDLNEQFRMNGVDAIASESNPIKIKFNKSGREYIVENNGEIIGPMANGNIGEEQGFMPMIQNITYTRNGNNLSLNTEAFEVELLDKQYIGELQLGEGATYGFEMQDDGTIVSEDLESLEGNNYAKSRMKIDLSNVEEDVIVKIEANSSSFGYSDISYYDEDGNWDGLFYIEGSGRKEGTINIEAGKVIYIEFYYEYAGKDEGNGITDSLTIERLEITKKVPDSELVNRELTYKYTVDGEELANNIITMDATKMSGKEAISGVNPKIPEGFAHIEGTIDNGYVISDLDKNYIVEVEVINKEGVKTTATKEITGNEFVWVPVSKENFTTEFRRANFEAEGEDRYEGFINGERVYLKYTELVADGENIDTSASYSVQEVQKMYKSVKDNGGFYIGRYETGIEGGRLIFDENTNWYSWNNTGKSVVKRNKQVYNNICWAELDGTGGALEEARKFSLENNYTSVTSTLCYGVQWDAVLAWINKDELLKEYLIDSTGKGNYSGELNKTGENRDYELKNIYDMAGNVWEWTMERYNDDSSYAFRGGCNYSMNDTISRRNSNGSIYRDVSVGFRIALYLNI